MWTTVSFQKLQSTNNMGRWFQANALVVGQGASNDAEMDFNQAIGLSLTQVATRSQMVEKEKNAAIQADTDRYNSIECLNRTGWAQRLTG
jgi:hypothetical protein